ncbi:NUDIX hydrolase domain-like protein [Diplogelasinospora grovesii]|uniref:NUDIX hydrolase domain-like protein n=1 Tax=Diplogelasinospora grovesii TaxID=303347 RepID=A0AAN6S7Q6_9PEZI|nr:NUDIX hydrolase domain-like protein [Diplogelasinospora grovesii]
MASQHQQQDNHLGAMFAPYMTTQADLGAWLAEIDTKMMFQPADALVISCGTVTLDLAEGKVLLIKNKKLNIYQLPKGRKNIGEDMLSAAVRETFEETGFHATPLQLNIATRATPPEVSSPVSENVSPKSSPQITDGHHSNECLGMGLYPDPQSDTPALKLIYYFAATADSTLRPQIGRQEDWEKFESAWVPISKFEEWLRFKGEIDAVKKAVENVKRTESVRSMLNET